MCRSRIRTPTASSIPRIPSSRSAIRRSAAATSRSWPAPARWNPRSRWSPSRSAYCARQGLGEVGLRYLEIAKEETGLPIVTELMDLSQLPLFKNVDVIQIGARNMQNFDLLKAVGRQEKPVMIKRGMSATYEEWLMSAEYIMSEGNNNVILCERGIRTFETYTRNTLDLSAVLRAPIWMTSTASSKRGSWSELISSVTMGMPVASLASIKRRMPSMPLPWKE